MKQIGGTALRVSSQRFRGRTLARRWRALIASTAVAATLTACGAGTAPTPAAPSGSPASQLPSTAPATALSTTGTTTPTARPVDVQMMDDAVRNQHADPFAVVPEAVWSKKVEAVAQAFPTADKDHRAMLLGQLAGLLDTHTQFFGPPELMYDVWFYRFADGMYVVAARDHTLVGARLISIGRTSAKDVEKLMQPVIPGDNPSARLNAAYLTAYVDHLHGLGIVADPSKPRFTFALASGRQRTVDLSSSTSFPESAGILGSTAGGFTQALRHRGQALWWRTDRASRSFVLSVNDYQDPSQAIAAMKKALDSRHADRVVVDLRYLRGGDPTPLWPLVDALKDPRVNSQAKFKVLIGRENESAATVLVYTIDTTTDATLIGEATPARADPFLCPCEDVNLPTTGYVFSVPQARAGNGDPRPAIAPDQAVAIRAKDFFAGRDVALNLALKLKR